jgi:hypothetical protein
MPGIAKSPSSQASGIFYDAETGEPIARAIGGSVVFDEDRHANRADLTFTLRSG